MSPKGGGKRKQKSEILIILLSPDSPVLKAVSASLKGQAKLNQKGVGNLNDTMIHDKHT